MDLESKRSQPLGKSSKLSMGEILCETEALQDYGLNLPIVLYFWLMSERYLDHLQTNLIFTLMYIALNYCGLSSIIACLT